MPTVVQHRNSGTTFCTPCLKDLHQPSSLCTGECILLPILVFNFYIIMNIPAVVKAFVYKYRPPPGSRRRWRGTYPRW